MRTLDIHFNGTIAARRFVLSHLTYGKGIGLYLQRTTSAFGRFNRRCGCGGRERVVSSNGRKKKASIRAMIVVPFVLFCFILLQSFLHHIYAAVV